MVVNTHKIRSNHIDPTMLKYIFLISNVCYVNGRLLPFLVIIGRALYLIDGPAGTFFFQQIHSTIQSLIRESGLADNRGTLFHFMPGVMNHPGKIQFLLFVSCHVNKISKETLRQIAHLSTGSKGCLKSRRFSLYFRLILIQPCHFGALPKIAVF